MPTPHIFPTRYSYRLSDAQQQRFADIFLLRLMINCPVSFPIDLPGNDSFLQPILTRLCTKGWARIDTKKALYLATEAGREPLQKFEQRFYDYLKVYDSPYNAISLTYGDFAQTYVDFFTSKEYLIQLLNEQNPTRWQPYIPHFQEVLLAREWTQDVCTAAWKIFLNLDEWEDLRVAVAEYKGLDPLEIVFMALLQGGHFDTPREIWQFDLASGWFFEEVEKIANNNYHLDQLIAPGMTSEQIMQNIITKGTELMMFFLEREAEQARQLAVQQAAVEARQQATLAAQQQAALQSAPQTQTVITTITELVPELVYVPMVQPVYHAPDYYNAYVRDPFFVDPIWVDPRYRYW